jgi:subtilisin family serine protease
MGRTGLLLATAAALLLPTSLATATPGAAVEERSNYIVVADADQNRSAGRAATHSVRGEQREVRSLTPSEAAQLNQQSGTLLVEQDLPITAHEQTTASEASQVGVVTPRSTNVWGLDRLDQQFGLDGWYRPVGDGSGVAVYLIDGSVAPHPEFGERLLPGHTVVEGKPGGSCDRHGTHVAGVIGSSRYGVAPGAAIIPVRVLDCAGTGTSSGLLDAIDWIIADHQARGSGPAVANLSLGAADRSTLIDQSVAGLATNGILPVVSAGNQRSDACEFSPAGSPGAISVAASTSSDVEASFSNWGTCLDIYAPGQGITSTHYDPAITTGTPLSGTSQAAPHVAGAAAVLWGLQPELSVTQIRDKVLASSHKDVLQLIRPAVGSPNALVTLATPAAGPAPETIPQQTSETLQAPKRVKRLWVKKRGSRNVVVRFRPTEDANRYRFEVKRKGSDSWRSRGTTQDRKYRIKRLRPDTTYRIRVTAKNRIGVSRSLTRKIRTR